MGFRCDQCGANFKRQEHLSRHVLSHNSEKPFCCPTCFKSFTRSDTLARHAAIHTDQGVNQNLRSAVSRISQACTNCAKSRLRCDGQKPCRRCASKNNECVYRGETRTRIRSRNPEDDPIASGSGIGKISGQSMASPRPSWAGSDEGSATNLMGISPFSQDGRNRRNDSVSGSSISANEGIAKSTVRTERTDEKSVYSESSNWDAIGMCPDEFMNDSFQGQNLTQSCFDSTDFTFDVHMDSGFDLTDWMVQDFSRPRPPQSLAFPGPLQQPNQQLDWGDALLQEDFPIGTLTSEELNSNPDFQRTQKLKNAQKDDERIAKSSGNSRQDSPSLSGDPNAVGITTDSKRNSDSKWPLHWNPRKSDNIVSFPDLSSYPRDTIHAENFPHVTTLDQKTYDQIHEIFIICHENSIYRPFGNSIFSLEWMNCFIQLYFEYFNPVYPLLHQATFDTTKTHWLLVLAVAAIGCHYSQVNAQGKCANALQEFLRRAIALVCEKDNSSVRKVWLSQASLLNCLGMLYSGNRRLLELCSVFRSTSVTQSRRNGSLSGTPCQIPIDETTEGPQLEMRWKQWIRQEELRRFGFCTMIYDCQFPLYFGNSPSMEFRELKQQLPCLEEIWEATSPTEWKRLMLQQQRTSSEMTVNLAAVLERFSSDAPIPKMGSFAKLIIVHAIHRHVWDMKQCEEMPLMPAFDTSQKQNWNKKVTNILSKLEPSSPEPAISLTVETHIHLVSLLLFLPIQALLNFARVELPVQESEHARQRLIAWIQDDNGQTARHAIVLASALFGKIRPRASSAFYEPAAFLTATLTLWTFSQLSGCQKSRADASALSAPHMSTIRLDRIRADEVQEWVERGENIRGYLGDVGNINDAETGNRILRVAIGCLGSMETWALAQGFVNVLSALYDRYKPGVDEVSQISQI